MIKINKDRLKLQKLKYQSPDLMQKPIKWKLFWKFIGDTLLYKVDYSSWI